MIARELSGRMVVCLDGRSPPVGDSLILVPEYVAVEGRLRSGLAVHVGGDRIVAVAPTEQAPNLPGMALLPGFVNAHSHAFQRGLRGHVQHAAGPDSFWSWRERMYELANELDPEGIYRISRLAFSEMRRAGFTSVGEFHYLHHQPDGTPYDDPDALALAVAQAAKDVGIRVVLLRVAYARAGFGVDPNPRQRRFIDPSPEHALAAVERLRRKGIDVGLAPHSVRACPVEWLRAFAGFDGVVHAHADEQPAEIAACLAEHGRRPMQVFADAGLLDGRFTAVHATHADADEFALRPRICACPSTELDLGDGFLPLERVQSPICIGTDSHALIDPFAELRSIEWHARAVTGRRNVLPHDGPDDLAWRLLQMGTRQGALSLGLDTGEIAPGRLADLVAIDITRLEFAESRLLPAIVFNGSPGAVARVWVGGV